MVAHVNLDNSNLYSSGRPKAVDRSQLFEAQTAYFQSHPAVAAQRHAAAADAKAVMLIGCKTTRTTVGRGHDATIKIGRHNKRVSRAHVAIEHKPQFDGFELTILSPNGALVDHIMFAGGEHVPVVEGTTIEIMGTRLIFVEPAAEDEHKPEPTDHCIPPPQPLQATALDTILPTSSDTNACTETKPVLPNTNDISSLSPVISAEKPKDLSDTVIRLLASSRKSSMTIREIATRMDYSETEAIAKVLLEAPCAGRIKRTGKTADGSPKEDLWYYQADLDPDQERRKQSTQTGRGARKCTMKDPQYFFRIPPKLPNQRKLYVPPPAHPNDSSKKRKSSPAHEPRGSKKTRSIEETKEDLSDIDDFGSTSSGNVSDQEVRELFQDV
ncbi:uncharacterized protein BYT42DRAFT_562280 [Radiomyces spectabilis]|uniref:uncharacterized protein n=1 Tax=Radiomyces spectabilis TaxID=64574 RepID=UPI0022211391|nr:uncharacterized protein BYT42DRAFT_562280 [Radiomyces spectabilis]KAI8384373.1 hypothetical protein BYT42DRAFT_562280 [Radiomyces spectabilis]